MNLLFDDVEVIESMGDPATVSVGGISQDSRRVRPGDLFCCVPGIVDDGHAFAVDAVERGAVGLLCEHFIPELENRTVVQSRVAPGTVRSATARLAAAFYDFPSRDLLMVGVTGTNGKTTVTQILGDLLVATGFPTDVMGTLSGARTTPEATELQRVLAEVRDRQRADGHRHAVAMEVSSHALMQSRVEGIHFDVAVFTNLSHDHLDYHGTMDQYFEAKANLFSANHALRAVINADDPWGKRLLERVRIPAVAVHRTAATDIVLAPGRTEFTWRERRVHTALTGEVNVDNALLAAEAAVALEIDPDAIAEALSVVSPVPGRLEVIATPGPRGEVDRPPFTVFVDYAHTPAGLEVVLGEARSLVRGGRVLSVFGCGGDRDRAKRPMMGEVAVRLSDIAVLTSDNPRYESPDAIIEDVLRGIPDGKDNKKVVVEPDRHLAIRRAFELARPGDLVVLAGKGHETYHEIAGEQLPFDDAVEARAVLSARYGTDPANWGAIAGKATAADSSQPEG
jgi:UDP-N-acetylmuramoyl-L-alanyl-D-glutamate--2,6-diaminopimelate ligase